MRLKTYFTDSVQEALGRARKELGEEAMLVDSRPAKPAARHLGRYEVIFAAGPADSQPGTVAGGAAGVSGADAAGGQPAEIDAELRLLRREIERLSSAMARSGTLGPAFLASSPALSRLYSELIRAEVSPELACEMLVRVKAAGFAAEFEEAAGQTRGLRGGISWRRLRKALEAEIDRRAPASSTPGREGARRKILALVGPPGVGKTSLTVKLAVRFGLLERRPTLLISTDTYRVGAAEQLRSYAAILGVPFVACETAGALAMTLEEATGKEVIVIDTASHSGTGGEGFAGFETILATHPEIEVHLTLSATTKTADLWMAVERFRAYQPRKLAFTRLDETAVRGGILELAAKTGLPVSYLSTGQQIPEDFACAEQRPVSSLVLVEDVFCAAA